MLRFQKNEGPLRPEDYEAQTQAMAEENRQLRTELEKMKRKKERGTRNWTTVWMVLGALVVVSVVVTLVVWESTLPTPEPSHPLVQEQAYPCYFIRHHRSSDDGESWQPWHLFKSTGRGSVNLSVETNPMYFNTKEEAWAFVQKWKLEACR